MKLKTLEEKLQEIDSEIEKLSKMKEELLVNAILNYNESIGSKSLDNVTEYSAVVI